MIAQSVCAVVATMTGTLAYTYPETLRAIRAPLIFIHDLSGDLLILAVLAYLWLHLHRTWKLRRLALSWWTGLASVLVFALVALTGIYGQLAPMPSGSLPSTAHLLGGLAVVALACFHGAHGLRRRIR